LPKREEVFDSPSSWVKSHIDEYVATNGEKGHAWRGATVLLLTTRGRKTSKLRRTALIYGRDGQNYIVVASRGGAEHHPAWYLNLAAEPEVDVQVAADKFTAKARVARGEERARLWEIMVGEWPAYADYQKKTEREIPIVILEQINA
jgi:deazaflavin-dependent oxidoreductase (nitroreductase family)